MNLRPRDKDKEIGPPSFRFNAKTGLERVYDSLAHRNSSFLDPKEVIEQQALKKLRHEISNDT
jgi:hypothetical protein